MVRIAAAVGLALLVALMACGSFEVEDARGGDAGSTPLSDGAASSSSSSSTSSSSSSSSGAAPSCDASFCDDFEREVGVLVQGRWATSAIAPFDDVRIEAESSSNKVLKVVLPATGSLTRSFLEQPFDCFAKAVTIDFAISADQSGRNESYATLRLAKKGTGEQTGDFVRLEQVSGNLVMTEQNSVDQKSALRGVQVSLGSITSGWAKVRIEVDLSGAQPRLSAKVGDNTPIVSNEVMTCLPANVDLCAFRLGADSVFDHDAGSQRSYDDVRVLVR